MASNPASIVPPQFLTGKVAKYDESSHQGLGDPLSRANGVRPLHLGVVAAPAGASPRCALDQEKPLLQTAIGRGAVDFPICAGRVARSAQDLGVVAIGMLIVTAAAFVRRPAAET